MDGVEVTRARVRQLFKELINDEYDDPDPDTFIETLDLAIRDFPQEDEFYASRAILAKAFDDIDGILDAYDSAVENIGSVPVRVRRFRTRAQLAEGLETIRSDFAALKDATIEEECLPACICLAASHRVGPFFASDAKVLSMKRRRGHHGSRDARAATDRGA